MTPPAENSHSAQPVDERSLGTFEGVFIPTLLTILGVMMYLRTGWVVGQVGLVGAWVIIGGAALITMATALSLSSVATNVKLGAGGPYGIIARSLGLEIGGSIGIPLFLSQAVAVTMYIFGLREGWLWLFPDHPAWLVDLVVFALVIVVSAVGVRFAFRMQYLIMGVIVLSLVSVFAAGPNPEPAIEWLQHDLSFTSSHFWLVFAVYFPAVTGVTAGANMSGELAHPDRSIPRGALSAVAISTVIYMTLAYWLAQASSGDELRNNFNVMFDHAAFPPLVIAGLIGATLSSAINSFVGAPRILQALAAHGVIPMHRFLAVRSGSGEPRRAMFVTAGVVGLGLLLRNLNAIAPLLTMFFLITYAGLNLVVLLEQRLAVLSFRPRLRLPAIVPLIGVIGSVSAMFITGPIFGLVAVVSVVLLYGALMRRHLIAPGPDVRSGAFRALAEWAAKHSSKLSHPGARSWKANLLIPVLEEEMVLNDFPLLVDLTVPYGSVTLIGIKRPHRPDTLTPRLARFRLDFMNLGVHATTTVVEAENIERGLVHAMQALQTAFLRPNTLLLNAGDGGVLTVHLDELLDEAKRSHMGAIVVAMDSKATLGKRSSINVWIREQGPTWELDACLQKTNINLLVLLSYILKQRWRTQVRLVTITSEDQTSNARDYLGSLIELARLPRDTEIAVEHGTFREALAQADRADINLMGLPNDHEIEFVRKTVRNGETSYIFVRDSGEENAFV